ncbi:hypothetical protein BB558_007018 [Smittium angustum]|uniref:Transmembrane protein 198 n=1 Tax=Smittium angustum TaxID=133377 RepID=A0A2U1IW83_SMIAN|nr:hypothetical protein BB558_007018 [Smittium angustum]
MLYLASLALGGSSKINYANIDITKNGSLTASGITAGVILMILGTIFLFYGRKLVKITIFFGGFFFLSIFCLVLTYWIRAPLNGENTRALIYVVLSIVLGLLGGALALWLYKINLLIIGVLGGFSLAVYIMNWSSTGFFSNNWAKIIFIIAFMIVGGLLVVFLERPAIIGSTSTYGSYSIFVGIDCFTRTGFKESIISVFRKTTNPVKNTPSMYGMLVGTIIFAIIGATIQFKITSKSKKHPHDPEFDDPKYNDGKYSKMRSNV